MPGIKRSQSCCNRQCIKMAAGVEDLKAPGFWRAVAAELVGTLFLTFIGCGSCLTWGEVKPTVVGIALCFGLAVATMVWAIGHVSGGHINPAVTAGFLITRKCSIIRALFYVVAQCTGAICGAGILMGLVPAEVRGNLGATVPNAALSQSQAFGTEFMITFVLVFTVFASCDGNRTDLNGSAPLTIGLSVTLCHLFAILVTGSSMNPARTIGPAVVIGIWDEHWVYWCGPVLGGIVAGLLYENAFAVNASLTKARGYLLASNFDPNQTTDSRDDSVGDDNDKQLKEHMVEAHEEEEV